MATGNPLQNHGVIILGRTVADAFFWLHRLEQACQTQSQLMATGYRRSMRPIQLLPPIMS
jgi:ribulose-5-phosphate 4-epimerase/fuculose-1-phosphate aldolase